MTLTEERTPSSQQNRLEQTENTEMLVVSLKQILKKKGLVTDKKTKTNGQINLQTTILIFFAKQSKKKQKKPKWTSNFQFVWL